MKAAITLNFNSDGNSGLEMWVRSLDTELRIPMDRDATLRITAQMLIAAGVRQAAFNGSELRAV